MGLALQHEPYQDIHLISSTGNLLHESPALISCRSTVSLFQRRLQGVQGTLHVHGSRGKTASSGDAGLLHWGNSL
jgi:hypothetical protein